MRKIVGLIAGLAALTGTALAEDRLRYKLFLEKLGEGQRTEAFYLSNRILDQYYLKRACFDLLERGSSCHAAICASGIEDLDVRYNFVRRVIRKGNLDSGMWLLRDMELDDKVARTARESE